MSAVGAVGVTPAAAGSTPGPAGLDAQKAQYLKQLADCENCASASTTEGKAKIEQLAAKLSAVDARLQRAAAARVEAAKSTTDATARAAPADSASATPGGGLDVYA